MCAGAAARAANKRAANERKYREAKRVRKYHQDLTVYGAKKVAHKRRIDAINMGLNSAFSRAQTKLNRINDKVWRDNNDAFMKHLKKSAYGDLLSAGATGQSIKRVGLMEAGALGRFYARNAAALTDAREDFMMGVKRDREKAKAAQERSFSSVAIGPMAGIETPPVVKQSVGWALFGDVLGFASTVAGIASSDSRLKKDIKKIGQSIDGHNIYRFKYLDSPKEYIGVMAEEVLAKNPEAVGRMNSGYWGVNYSKIDVDFKEVV